MHKSQFTLNYFNLFVRFALTCLTVLYGSFNFLQAQVTLYSEPFATNTITNDCASWNTSYAPLGDVFKGYWFTRNTRMEGTNISAAVGASPANAVWYSQSINISGQTSVTLSANFGWSGGMEASDYVRAYYSIDGGAETIWFDGADDTWAVGVKTSAVLAAGSTLQIVIRSINNDMAETYYFDDVTATDGINGVLWSEAFATNSLSNACPTWWTLTDFTTTYSGFITEAGVMESEDPDYEAKWESATVSLTGYYNVGISIDFSSAGNQTAFDYIKAYYVLNGGGEVLWFDGTDDTWSNGVKTISGLSGTSLKIVIRVLSNGASEFYRFDNVLVTGCNTVGGNYPFTAASVALANDYVCTETDYTFTQTTDAACGAAIPAGVVCSVTFPAGTNASSCTGGGFNGTAIASYTVVSATQVNFTTSTSVASGTAFSFVLRDIANPSANGNASVSVTNVSGGSNSYSTYGITVQACPGVTNGTFTSVGLTVNAPNALCVASYTFTQTVPSAATGISMGAIVTIDFIAGTDATTMTGGTFNGVAIPIGTVTVSPLQISFPATSNASAAAPFKIVLNGIKNPGIAGSSGNLSVSIANLSGGITSNTAYPVTYNGYLLFFTNTLGYSSFPSLATATTNGWCYSPLTAGATYCFNFTFPSSGNVELDWVVSDPDGAGPCVVGSVYNARDPAATNCASGAANPNIAVYANSCNFMYNAIHTGGSAPCNMVGGTVYSICYTVPADCGGMSICPIIYCSSGPSCAGGSLPVQMLSFFAVKDHQNVLLRWSTVAETNNDHFEIQRSSDGLNYATVGKITGAGTSNSISNYEFIDLEVPASAVLYYRLKQVDHNGAFEYFGPVAVSSNPPSQWSFELQGSFASEYMKGILVMPEETNCQIYITDMRGRLIQQEQLSVAKGTSLIKIDLEGVEAGLYVISVYNGTEYIRHKFFKL